MARAPDRWHRWLLDVRFGGDAAAREQDLTEFLYPVRDKVLDNANPQPVDTLLDVGTGDGLIAFGALQRLGPSGHVIFSDISQDLLDHCQAAAAAEGLLDRCRFVLTSADFLTEIADASVEVVTTRSVLIYVKDKAAALRKFYRVLRPGGRVSLFEPINVLMRDRDRLYGYDITPVKPLAAKLQSAGPTSRWAPLSPALTWIGESGSTSHLMQYRSVLAAAAGRAAAFADVAAACRAHLGAAGEAERSVRGPALLGFDQFDRAVRARGRRGHRRLSLDRG